MLVVKKNCCVYGVKTAKNSFGRYLTYKCKNLRLIFQQIEEKVWKQINGASETDSPC